MKKITVVLLAFMLLVLSGCGGAGKASSFLLDSAGDKLLTVTAENDNGGMIKAYWKSRDMNVAPLTTKTCDWGQVISPLLASVLSTEK